MRASTGEAQNSIVIGRDFRFNQGFVLTKNRLGFKSVEKAAQQQQGILIFFFSLK